VSAARKLLGRFPGARVVAFDVDRAMLAVAERLELAIGDLRRPDRLTRLGDGSPLRLVPGSCDGVLVGAALEHVPLVDALSQLRDLLRPGGLLLILGVREGGMGAFLGRLYRFRPYSLGQLRAGLSACGLVGIRTIPLRPREFPANLSRVAMLARRPDRVRAGGDP
jgi:SAM-dependent methyltransferase